jgi:hypothetical protein
MKRIIITSLVIAMIVGISMVYANPEGTPDAKKIYSLNIIGVSNPKDGNMDKAAGNVIFVNLEGPNKINLVDSAEVAGLDADDFAVLDKDATDSDPKDPESGALLALPKPGFSAYNVTSGAGKTDTVTDYSVYVRPLGKPGGSATITTCAELLDSDFAGLLSGKFVSVLNKLDYFGGYASVEQVGSEITLRTNGKNGRTVFTDVTAELLSIVFMVSVDIAEVGEEPEIITEYIRVPIFDPIIQGEYWDYDNDGLKLLQVRFYQYGVDVSLSDNDWNNLPE